MLKFKFGKVGFIIIKFVSTREKEAEKMCKIQQSFHFLFISSAGENGRESVG